MESCTKQNAAVQCFINHPWQYSLMWALVQVGQKEPKQNLSCTHWLRSVLILKMIMPLWILSNFSFVCLFVFDIWLIVCLCFFVFVRFCLFVWFFFFWGGGVLGGGFYLQDRWWFQSFQWEPQSQPGSRVHQIPLKLILILREKINHRFGRSSRYFRSYM